MTPLELALLDHLTSHRGIHWCSPSCAIELEALLAERGAVVVSKDQILDAVTEKDLAVAALNARAEL